MNSDVSAFGVVHKAVSAALRTQLMGLPTKTKKPAALHGMPSHRHFTGKLREDKTGVLGPGAYTTTNPQDAAVYAEGKRRKGNVVGRMYAFDPKSSPRVESGPHRVYDPDKLGKPIHSQNVKRTTQERLIRRQFGDTSKKPSAVPSLQDRLKEYKRTRQIHPSLRRPVQHDVSDFN